MTRVIRMIQPIKNSAEIKITETINVTETRSNPKTPQITKDEVLNIYEESLQVAPPTYSEDVKIAMRKEGIEDSVLNTRIVELMDRNNVDISKDALDIVVNRLQDEDLIRLFEEGYDIETLTIDIIAKEIKQNQAAQNEVDLDQDQEGSDESDDITKILVEAGLPITNKNIEVIMLYKEKIKDIKDNSNITASNMVRHNSNITINNLYIVKHKGRPKGNVEIPTDEQIIAVLNMNGINPTQENIKAAASLVGANIEITEESLRNFIKIKQTIDDIDMEDLLNRAADTMKKGESPGDTSLIVDDNTLDIDHDKLNQIVENIIEDIPRIDETIIEETYKKKEPITLENLQKTLHENIDKVLKVNQDQMEPEKITTTKRQLEEIRLSLTLEAALKLSSKLDIQTTELTKVVEELKVIEKEHSQEILINIGAAVTEENIVSMEQTSEKLHNISQNKEIAMAEVIKDEAESTIDGMDQAIRLKRAQNIYEETGTRPERRFGEGIAKVEGQIEHILDINKIEPTDSNIRAAKALIENDIDISPETVQDAKIVLLKIETVLHELKPAVVAQIIKEGIRPDTMPMDSLIEYVRDIRKKGNIDLNQRVAEGILELDKTNQLDAKEREGLVAVYRMLSTITKNETAAVGFLVDNNKELTLGNLFEASKYIKQVASKTGKIDVRVDDELGLNEGELPKNIRSIIKEATQVDSQIEQKIHTSNIIRQWLSRITPEELKKYVDMDKSLEELELKDGRLSSFESERMIKQARHLEKASPNALTFIKEHNISPTISNLYWTDKMIKNPSLLGDMLREYEDITGEEIKTSLNKNSKDQISKNQKQDIEKILEGLETELQDQSQTWLSDPRSMQAYSVGKDLEQMLGAQKQIAQNEGIYQIPIELHHGMSNLNLYVMKDKEQSNRVESNELKAYMSIKTKNMGIIQVNMRITDNALAFEMIGETPEITLGLQKDSRELKAAIEDIGYNVMHAKFIPGKTKTSIIDKPRASDSLLKYRFEDSKFEHII